MSAEAKEFAAGSLIYIETGEYSDYSVHGHFVVLEDFDRAKMEELWSFAKARHEAEEEKTGWGGDIHGYFVSEMIRAGLVLSLDCTEIHIGSYGRLEL